MDAFIQVILGMLALGSAWFSGMMVILWEKADSARDKKLNFQAANMFGVIAVILGAVALLV